MIDRFTLPYKFKIALSIASTLAILHSQGLVHGNIRHSSVRVISSLHLCVVGDYALTCTLNHMKEDRFIAPEIVYRGEATVKEATTQKSMITKILHVIIFQGDVYALGVLLFELFMMMKYNPSEKKFYIKILPEAITDLIYRCLNENENLRYVVMPNHKTLIRIRPSMKEVFTTLLDLRDSVLMNQFNEE